MIYSLSSKECFRKDKNMNNDKLLSLLSQHIAYWYTSIKGEKDIIFPINNVIKESANQIFKNRYHEADTITSENGDIYKISLEVGCESNVWSYVYYLDDMKKNYRLKRICQDLLPYNLNDSNIDKLKKISKLKIPCKIISFKIKPEQINQVKEIIYPYLKCYAYINSRKRKIIAYPDVVAYENNQIKILLNYYHHHHMERHIKKIKKAILKYKEIESTIQNK